MLNELRQRTDLSGSCSRPRLPTCSRPSAARHSIYSWCSTLSSRPLRNCASAHRGVIFKRDDGNSVSWSCTSSTPYQTLSNFIRRNPIAPGRNTITARVALERQTTVHVADLQADAEYTYAVCATLIPSERNSECLCSEGEEIVRCLSSCTNLRYNLLLKSRSSLVKNIRRSGGHCHREHAFAQ